jgi:large conductance mechanosensitive channel
MLDEFKKFLLRGNVIDLAVAIVIGVAFAAVVTSLVQDLITPLLAIPGETDFSDLTFTINDSTFFYGRFINALISFVLIAAAVFFLIVKPINALIERSRSEPVTADPTTRKCPECLSEIPIAAKRCAFCASPLSSTP